MPVLTLLTLFSSIMENTVAEAALRPYVTMDPDWRTIFEDDEMTLTCNVPDRLRPNEDDFYWYKNNERFPSWEQKLHIRRAKTSNSGEYQCKTSTSDKSEPVQLDVSRGKHKLLLQSPPNIVEGDALDMRCHSSSGYNKKEDTTFYKDADVIQRPRHNFHLPNVNKSMSGIYRCEKTIGNGKLLKSDETFIFVQDLFTSPTIRATTINIKEGDAMTLTCDTRLNPLREDTALEFSFYKNGDKVQEFGPTRTYKVQPAKLEDSGNYNCRVRTPKDAVRKMSNVLHINIRAAVNKPNLTLLPSTVAVGRDVLLRCQSSKGSVPIYYLFYHNQTFIGNITTRQKGAAELRLSIKSLTMGGLYYCISQNDFHTQQQQSEVVSLLVIEPVEGITITADKEGEDFAPGQSLTFTCSIQRGSSISVFWKHNESLVEESSDHYQLQDNGKVLYIDSLQNHHKGTYQCHANNALNRTFSVYSETRNINILDISAADHSFQWAMLGVLLFVLILIIALIFKFRETIVCPGRGHKTPSSTGRETQKDNGDDGQRNNTTGSEGIYQNTVATRRDIDDDVSYAYINIRAPQAASSYPTAARDNDFQVLYSTVKCSDVTPETTTDEKTLEMSTAIYHTITAHDINHRQPNLMEDMKEG